MEKRLKRLGAAALGLAIAAGAGIAASECCWLTEEPPQIVGDTSSTGQGWEVLPLVTVGETNADGDDVNLEQFGYRVPGILDGIGAWRWDKNTVRVLVNHEFSATQGYAYTLANGTSLVGARVSWFDIDRDTRKVCGAGLAYDRVFDRAGTVVTSAAQINEGASGGFDRFCSSHGFAKGEKGFADDIYFCGEETGNGQECAIDVRECDCYVAPMLGRAAWENLCALRNVGDRIVLLIGDDSTGAPLYLYVGEKGAAPDSGYTPPAFLKRNGLGLGNLYVWVSDDGDVNPSTFNGTGSSRAGTFKRIVHFDASKAGTAGYDSLGFASMATQWSQAATLGAFRFSRPEDVSTNPRNGRQAVLVSTGASGFAGGADSWGTTYLVDIPEGELEKKLAKKLDSIDGIKAKLTIVYDGDDAGDGQFTGPDYGLRSPDNLDWAGDGLIYIQEDDAISAFGTISGIEASMWSLDPKNGKLVRILEIDRSAVPLGQSDPFPGDRGNWESSGVLDVTKLFRTKRGERLLILDTEAHSLSNGLVGGSSNLVQGGQLLLASKMNRNVKDWDQDCDD